MNVFEVGINWWLRWYQHLLKTYMRSALSEEEKEANRKERERLARCEYWGGWIQHTRHLLGKGITRKQLREVYVAAILAETHKGSIYELPISAIDVHLAQLQRLEEAYYDTDQSVNKGEKHD